MRTSHELGAEIGELMCSQERSGGSCLRRSSPTQGSSYNGRSSSSLVLCMKIPEQN